MTTVRKKSFTSHTLDDPQRALRLYLDALLSEVPLAEPEAAEEATDTPPAEAELAGEAALQTQPSVAEAASGEETPAGAEEQLQPDWATDRFQCLSFQVAGVTLAAPLEKMNGIVELTDTITELPGYAPWVLGLLPNRGQNVQVVDIAKIIMPQERQEQIAPAAERIKYVILIDGGRFGLAADGLSQVLTLEPDAVRWRSRHSKRPWLAGTVVDQMCALLEIDQLREQLAAGLDGGDIDGVIEPDKDGENA